MTDQRQDQDIELTTSLTKTGETSAAATRNDIDSAYGTVTQSGRSTMTQDPTQEPNRVPQQGRKIHGTDLYLFKKEGDPKVLEHYGKICDGVDALLEDEIRAAGCDKFQSMGMRVGMAGTSEQEATLRLLVFCAQEVKKTVVRFFKSTPVTALLNPDRPNSPKLDYVVIPEPPNKRSAPLDVDVHCKDSWSRKHGTYCGAPILLTNGVNATHKRQSHQATFGGIIKVTKVDHVSQLYGITAGHFLEAMLSHRTSEDPDGSERSCGSSSTLCDDDGWIGGHNIMGQVVDSNQLPGVTSETNRPTHDWALFDVERPRPNEAVYPTSDQNHSDNAHQILIAARPSFKDRISDSVLLLSGVSGTVRGELSSHPARIWLNRDVGFVQAYMLELNENHKICDGDSGSWVVHSAGQKLYGHVVATDALGDAYVLPAVDTFDNIRDCMGAIAVQLPCPNDFDAIQEFPAPVQKPVGSYCLEDLKGIQTSPAPVQEPVNWAHPENIDAIHRSRPPVGDPVSRCTAPVHAPHYRHDNHGRKDRSSKRWNTVFSTERHFVDEQPYVEWLRSINAEGGDSVDLFMSEYLGGTRSFRSKEVMDFCRSTDAGDFEMSKSNSTTSAVPKERTKAWLDDRSFGSESSRTYDYRLTVNELYHALSRKRFGLQGVPDADRRLIYIPDLTPRDIRVLTETASFDQVEVLRDAIWKHLALQTSIQVRLPKLGYPTFRLQFHVPYFALREKSPPNGITQSVGTGPRRAWRDLTFLNRTQKNANHVQDSDGVHDAHISLVICGSDHTRWVCYAFADTKFNRISSHEDEDEEEDEEDENFECKDKEDPIASDGEHYLVAEDPIWDPREYFLRILDIRMKHVLREWTHLVRKVENNIEANIMEHPVIVPRSSYEDKHYFENDVEWIVQAIDLLRSLRRRISQTIRAWERFESPGGDICYFSELFSQESTVASLDGIRESFEELQDIKETLIDLDELCRKNICKILELRMSLESHRLNLESHQLERNNHFLNQKTSLLNRDGIEINMQTMEVTLANHRTNEIALSMNLVITACAVPVAIYSMQQKPHTIIRDSKSLFLCIVITGVILYSLVYIKSIARKQSWARRIWKAIKNWVSQARSRDKDLDGHGLAQSSTDSTEPWRDPEKPQSASGMEEVSNNSYQLWTASRRNLVWSQTSNHSPPNISRTRIGR